MSKLAGKSKKDLQISWLGIDGLLVLGYFVVVGIIYFALATKNDFIVGTLIPFGIMIVVTAIFINYLSIVLKFNKSARKTSEESIGQDK